MASVTKNEKTMATTDAIFPGADEPEDRKPTPQRDDKAAHHGFFAIHKKGQGYWTRICSAAAAGLLIVLTAQFLYSQLPAIIPALENHTRWVLGVVGAFVLGSSVLIWWLMNKAANVDFLIATDSEMKKVNWTSRTELIGSTKVVIFFMLLIAALLFVLDMYFTRVFFLLGVLTVDSPMWGMVADASGGKAAGYVLDVVMFFIVFGSAAWAVYGTSRSR
jgi:preprotein translocase subunit SecE